MGTDYTYTPGGRLKTRTWAREGTGNERIVTTYTYGFDDATSGNDTGDLMEVSYANDPQNTPSVAYTYDRRGLQKTITQGSTTTTLAYTDVGQLQSESYSGGTLDGLSVASGYDTVLRRNLLQAFNGASPLTATSYGYDNGGRLSTVTDNLSAGQPYSATYGYLANSPLVGTVTFKQNTTTRMTTTKEYDALNRLYDTKSAVNGLTPAQVRYGYNYNAANQRTRATQANGSFWEYGYDYLGQVTSGKHRWVDSSLVGAQQFEYGFDEIGNRLSTKAGGSATGTGLRSATYTPNRLNEYDNRTVPAAIDVLGAAAVNATVTVEGQTADRRGAYFWKETALNNATAPVWEQINVVSGANQDNRYAFLPKTPEAFTHDADGNLKQDGRWDYTWDAENRLVKQESLSSAPAGSKLKLEFTYDWKGRRIQKKVSTWNQSTSNYQLSTDRRFIYDGWNLLSILNPQSSILQSFTWGLDLSGSEQGAGGVGGLLMLTDQTTINNAPSTHFASYDGNGNLAALIKASDGTASANYEYGPFGELIRMTGPMAKANVFRFSTKYQDDESDQLYYGYRSYNPSTGRWLSRDPIEENGGVNLFGFIGNNGAGDVDILGLRKTRFSLTEMEAMLNKSRQDFQSKLIAKCGLDDLSWIDSEGNKQCCHLSTCVKQAELLALAFDLKLRMTFTANFKQNGDVIAFHEGWIGETINTRANKAPGNGMHANDFDEGFGLKCWGMQMLMTSEFQRTIRPFRDKKTQCFKGAEVGNHEKNTKASHHWFGIYIGTNKDKTQIDVLVDPWYSAGGIISPTSAGQNADQAKYFVTNLW